MREPSFGKENLGAVIGAVLGSIGGLMGVAIPYAIMTRNVTDLSAARTFGILGFFVGTPVGWFAGGYIADWLGRKLPTREAGVLGGILGGLLPALGFALVGFLMSRH
ncbi:MAG: hypothetical protein HOP33_21465 [Verrucomicrobia bacterium]|nr:hypothetical protein [Verrucomicrobiota bacterium]